MNCMHLGLMIDAGDSGIKAIRNACDRYEARRCTEAQTSCWKGDIATSNIPCRRDEGPMANDAALQRSARRWDLWRRIYWPIRVFSGCSDDRRQMVAGLQNVTPFPRKTLRAATVILLARFYYLFR